MQYCLIELTLCTVCLLQQQLRSDPGNTKRVVWGLQKGDDIASGLDLSKENRIQVQSQHVSSTSKPGLFIDTKKRELSHPTERVVKKKKTLCTAVKEVISLAQYASLTSNEQWKERERMDKAYRRELVNEKSKTIKSREGAELEVDMIND